MPDLRARYAVAQWLVWEVANHDPKHGENGNFRRAEAVETHWALSYARRRFDDEANRMYGAMEEQRSISALLAGEDTASRTWPAIPGPQRGKTRDSLARTFAMRSDGSTRWAKGRRIFAE